MKRESDLLFGLLALQMNLITKEHLLECAAVWMNEPERRLGRMLQDKGYLAVSQHAAIKVLVEEQLKLHAGNPGRTLAAAAMPRDLRETLLRAVSRHVAGESQRAELTHTIMAPREGQVSTVLVVGQAPDEKYETWGTCTGPIVADRTEGAMSTCCFGLRLRGCFLLLLGVVLLASCRTGEPPPSPVKAPPSADVRPRAGYKTLSIRVFDAATGEPVSEFAVDGSFRTLVDWYALRTRGTMGMATVEVPDSCLVSLEIFANNFLGKERDVAVLSRDTYPAVDIALEHGMRATGRVVASDDGAPIAGAYIGHLIVSHPILEVDHRRGSVTGSDGTFDLEGVEPGNWALHFSHPEFEDRWVRIGEMGDEAISHVEGLTVELTREHQEDWKAPSLDPCKMRMMENPAPETPPQTQMPIAVGDLAQASGGGAIKGSVFAKGAG